MTTKLNYMKNIVMPILKEAGVTRSAFFGSYAKGEENDKSDVDIIVDFPRGRSLFDLSDLQFKLESALGKKTDAVTYKSLHPLLKNRILSEQITIFEI